MRPRESSNRNDHGFADRPARLGRAASAPFRVHYRLEAIRPAKGLGISPFRSTTRRAVGRADGRRTEGGSLEIKDIHIEPGVPPNERAIDSDGAILSARRHKTRRSVRNRSEGSQVMRE